MKKSTMSDVADRAGVSIKTVSRVLNKEPYVAEGMRDKVLVAMKDCDYTPNLIARDLASKASRVVAYIFLSRQHLFSKEYYFTEIFDGAHQSLVDKEYFTLFLSPDQGVSDPVAYVDNVVKSRKLSGIFLADLVNCDLDAIKAMNIPTVLLNRRLVTERIASILPDFAGGMSQVVHHLHGLGHRRVGFFGMVENRASIMERHDSFVKTSEELGIAVDPAAIYPCADNTRNDSGEAIKIFLNTPEAERPTALCCATDLMAVTVIKALHEHGIRVPEDVSVTGFDNVDISQVITPALTTVSVPRHSMGQQAADKLIRMVSGDDDGEIIEVPTELVIRESTGPAPG
jgi:LacI family transcriptional regulator, galactose operon repressor